MSRALAFLAGVGPDHLGRTLDEIATWDHRRLEQTHDYIQWVFPTMVPSRFNPHAPVLDAADVAAGARDPRVVGNLLRMAVVMGRFYGLERTDYCDGPQYDPIDDQHPCWMRADNHNFLRITRILGSLRLFGLVEEAEAWLDALEELVRCHSGPVSDETRQFWRDAATPRGANPR
ncbi:MAG: opioid growth factor receptor-related protein [Gammaproteobacteria bacterium]|nr:opioid growth factor receptor-related protein [Gammaproteobacteria bacterium]